MITQKLKDFRMNSDRFSFVAVKGKLKKIIAVCRPSNAIIFSGLEEVILAPDAEIYSFSRNDTGDNERFEFEQTLNKK